MSGIVDKSHPEDKTSTLNIAQKEARVPNQFVIRSTEWFLAFVRACLEELHGRDSTHRRHLCYIRCYYFKGACYNIRCRLT